MSEFVRTRLALYNIPQRTEEWYKAREGRLTASDVAAAIGQNPHTSTNQLLKRKLCPKPFSSPACAWGQKYEDQAIARYERCTGEIVWSCGLFVHPTIPAIAGSPDGLTNSGKLIEVKCPFRKGLVPHVPDIYMPQVQTCLEVLDAEACDFIQYIPGTTWVPEQIIILTVPRDRAWFAKHLPAMLFFHQRLLHREICPCQPAKRPLRPKRPEAAPVYLLDDSVKDSFEKIPFDRATSCFA